MKIHIGFRDELRATAGAQGVSEVRWDGAGAGGARRLASFYAEQAQGEGLLRLLLKKLRGSWWAEEIADEGDGETSESLLLRDDHDARLMESLLLEAGFTGEKKVTVGGREQTWHYRDGKRVSAPGKAEGGAKKPAAPKPPGKPAAGKKEPAAKKEKPAKAKAASAGQVHDAVKAAIEGGKPVRPEDVDALAKAVMALKTDEIKGIRQKLGLTKGGGAKAELAAGIVAKVVKAMPKPGAAPKAEAAPAPAAPPAEKEPEAEPAPAPSPSGGPVHSGMTAADAERFADFAPEVKLPKSKLPLQKAAPGMRASRMPGSADFRPAATAEEATGRLERLGVGKVSVGPDAVGRANETLQALEGLKRIGFAMPASLTITGEGMNPATNGDFNWGTGELRINPKASQRVAAYAKHKGDSSTTDPLHTVVHEMVHKAHRDNVDGMSIDRANEHFASKFPALSQAEQDEVSSYGKTQGVEFVAEVGAGLHLGVEYSPKIVAMYREMGGVMPGEHEKVQKRAAQYEAEEAERERQRRASLAADDGEGLDL